VDCGSGAMSVVRGVDVHDQDLYSQEFGTGDCCVII
jgi:hypothetical protein